MRVRAAATTKSAKPRTVFRCEACGHTSAKWTGRCLECQAWGTVKEDAPLPTAAGMATPIRPAVPITQIDPKAAQPTSTGISEFDRVLGGGLVRGAVVLLAGEPGVGKSTLLLEVARRWKRGNALYVTGEESAGQVRLRADRTGALSETLYLAAESDLGTILGHVDQVQPTLLIIDSIQTLSARDVDGVHGGVTQVRAITAALTSLAKATGIAVILVGHVTKDGAVAGPRSLEHLVDVVLSFEGDKHSSLRMIRGVKNRFGPADEVGCFEQREDGIHEVTDPSGLFLEHRERAVVGTAITVVIDGKRPMVAEIQALTQENKNPNVRRAVSGIDSTRVSMIIAVLGAAGITLGYDDVYAATVGGMKITEPAVDAAVALALASAKQQRTLPERAVVLGEVGLAGEFRRVSAMGTRLREAARLGFTDAVVPEGTEPFEGIRLRQARTVADALALCKLK